MSEAAAPQPLPPPEYHGASEALWFWVRNGESPPVRASISRQVLHYRLDGQSDGSDAAKTYAAHRALIDAAVLRRVAAGSRDPVLLRESDLTPLPTTR